MSEVVQGYQNRPEHLLGHEHVTQVTATVTPSATLTVASLHYRPGIVSKLDIPKSHLTMGRKSIGITGISCG